MFVRRPLVIASAAILLTVACGLAIYRYGRSLWHPVVVRLTGEATVADRMRQIALRHPDLPGLEVRHVRLICFKDPGVLHVQLNGRLWRSFPLTAQSGGPGPKLRAGDGQIPEGLYRIDAVNPNSAYHLSLRVSYPNATDRRRSAAAGVSDLGGDIYIHGKDVSIGCIALGDDAIEQVFYVVNRVAAQSVEVLIAPYDLMSRSYDDGEHRALYAELRRVLAAWTAPISVGGGPGRTGRGP